MLQAAGYIRYTHFIFVMVFIVILAGGVVRMTQSGMGCPDWPTCFGRWIPPSNANELPDNFEKYLDKQDIDHRFNPYHTWIEYINRLLGALLGVFIFIHFIWSWRKYRKVKKEVFWLSFLLLIGVGFQGWLGKQVVAHNLAVVKITIHMLVALALAAIPLLIINRFDEADKIKNNKVKYSSLVLLLLIIVQIILGTQVREQIDEISKPLKYQQRELWVAGLNNIFIIHRSFSWLLFAAGLGLTYTSWKYFSLRKNTLFILILILAAAGVGLIMAWCNIPAWAQPLHLLLAGLLALTVFHFMLRVK